ncbi:hypothetical protein NDA13_004522 [Ustilago tritici]|nr:hypothetical protein NDA13_004522 [Ustilago tritici]
MFRPKTFLHASSLFVTTWNCATLNDADRIAALHDSSSLLGHADVVFLQEMRLASPQHLDHYNPFLRLHHPFASRSHQAILGQDTGILIWNTTWEIGETDVSDHSTYAHVRIPATEPAFGANIQNLHLWSIHAPPNHGDRQTFWNNDIPGLSRLDAAAHYDDTAAIIGADWNAVVSHTLDQFPSGPSLFLPLGQLAHAGLVDTFHTLHPTGTSYTRYNIICGEMTTERRIDSIWTSHSLVPHLQAVTTRPSASDHSTVSATFKSSAHRSNVGPGMWGLHRHAHLQPGFKLKL